MPISALLNLRSITKSCGFVVWEKVGCQYFEAARVPEPIAWNLDSALRPRLVSGLFVMIISGVRGLRYCKITSLFLFRYLK